MKPFYFFILLLAVSCQESVSSNAIDFRTAVDMMLENNATIKAAEKSTLLAKRQSQLINASWLPTITMTADYTMMSNGIGVSQDYASLLEPFKEKYAETPLVPDILNLISNELGDLAFEVPIFEDDFGSIDLEILYPIFTGTKRLYANKLAKSNEALSEINKESVGAAKYLELANVYFSLSLAESMIKVLKETHKMTDNHYSQPVAKDGNIHIRASVVPHLSVSNSFVNPMSFILTNIKNEVKKITAQNIKSYAVMYRQFNIFSLLFNHSSH